MDKQWAAEREARYRATFEPAYETVLSYISDCPQFDEDGKAGLEKAVEQLAEKGKKDIDSYYDTMYALMPGLMGVMMEDAGEEARIAEKMYEEMGVRDAFERVARGREASSGAETFLDSEPRRFHGDIVITDPCYFGIDDDDDLEDILSEFMERDTIDGDWGCYLIDMATGEPLGRFCADSGMVCVANLEEVERLNPGWMERFDPDFPEFGCAVVRDFDGEAWFEVREESFEYKGELATELYVVVCGRGRDSATGREIVFESRQTSL